MGDIIIEYGGDEEYVTQICSFFVYLSSFFCFSRYFLCHYGYFSLFTATLSFFIALCVYLHCAVIFAASCFCFMADFVSVLTSNCLHVIVLDWVSSSSFCIHPRLFVVIWLTCPHTVQWYKDYIGSYLSPLLDSHCVSHFNLSFLLPLIPSTLLFSFLFFSLHPASATGNQRNIERMRAAYLSWWNRTTVQYNSWINLFTWRGTLSQTVPRLTDLDHVLKKQKNSDYLTVWILLCHKNVSIPLLHDASRPISQKMCINYSFTKRAPEIWDFFFWSYYCGRTKPFFLLPQRALHHGGIGSTGTLTVHCEVCTSTCVCLFVFLFCLFMIILLFLCSLYCVFVFLHLSFCVSFCLYLYPLFDFLFVYCVVAMC